MKEKWNKFKKWARENKPTAALTVIAILAIVVAVLIVVNNKTGVEAKATADPGRAPETGCSEVHPDPNRNFNYVSNTADDGLAVHDHFEDLAAVKTDQRSIAERAWRLGYWADPKNFASLADGNCLSPKGVELYNLVYADLTNSTPGTVTEIDDNSLAPEGYINSGMGPNGPVVNGTPGIEGNRAAIKYTVRRSDGTIIIIFVLKRCGNETFEFAPPAFPPVSIVPVTPEETPPPEFPPTFCNECNQTPPTQVCESCNQPPPTEIPPPPPPPTEFPPPPPPTPTPPPTNITLAPKPPLAGPGAQDNAPQGQGGQMNNQLGKGPTTVPTTIAETPYVAPPPPPPSPATGADAPTLLPAPVSTPAPAPGVNGTPGSTGTTTAPNGTTRVDGQTGSF